MSAECFRCGLARIIMPDTSRHLKSVLLRDQVPTASPTPVPTAAPTPVPTPAILSILTCIAPST